LEFLQYIGHPTSSVDLMQDSTQRLLKLQGNPYFEKLLDQNHLARILYSWFRTVYNNCEALTALGKLFSQEEIEHLLQCAKQTNKKIEVVLQLCHLFNPPESSN